MHLTTEVLVAIVAAIIALLAVMIRRSQKKQTVSHRTTTPRGPSDLRYICKRCAVQSTHTKRTIGAYEKGTRSFFCNSCHSKWRESNPPKSTTPPTNSKPLSPSHNLGVGRPTQNSPVRRSFNENISHSSVKSSGGCLGAILLIAVIPIVVITIVANNA